MVFSTLWVFFCVCRSWKGSRLLICTQKEESFPQEELTVKAFFLVVYEKFHRSTILYYYKNVSICM